MNHEDEIALLKGTVIQLHDSVENLLQAVQNVISTAATAQKDALHAAAKAEDAKEIGIQALSKANDASTAAMAAHNLANKAQTTANDALPASYVLGKK